MELTVSDNITFIDRNLLLGSDKLEYVTLAKSGEKIPILEIPRCFPAAQVSPPDDVEEIGVWERYIDSDGNAVFPEGVRVIGDCAFSNCERLKTVTVTDSVARINMGAFQGCKNLMKVTLPVSVAEVEESAFYESENLKTITLSATGEEITVEELLKRIRRTAD